MDEGALRAASLEHWTRSASGWERRAARVERHAELVTERMLAATGLAAGDRVLEVACGTGGLGLAAARRVAPDGRVLMTDFSPAMVDAARRRVREAAVENIDVELLDGERLDLPDARMDVVLCRFGLMLMQDPTAAAREMRRVCAPGGRLAVAVWGPQQANPWASLPMTMLMSRLGAPPPDPSAPGMFALGDPQKLERAIEQAGFRDTTVAQVAGVQRHESFEAWWEETRELTAAFDDLVTAMDAAARERLMTALRTEAEAFEDDDGLAIPSLALLASAER